MCCLCLLEKKYDFGFGNIDCHYWCAPSNRATACLYAGSADEDGGGPQCVLTFGFEHGMETKVHAQCARRDNSMHAVETPWEHNESACNRQLERRRNAMQLRRNAMVAVRSPWKRRDIAKRIFNAIYGALWKLATPYSRSGNAAMCHRGFSTD